MTVRASGWIIALTFSLAVWGLIFCGVSAAAECPLAGNPYYATPACSLTPVCQFSGPGGCIYKWTIAAELAVLEGKTINVPAKVCASACVIAVGKAIEMGGKVEITSGAKLVWPHGQRSFRALRLPQWFARKVLVQSLVSGHGTISHAVG